MVLYFIIQRIIVILTMILFFVWILYGTLNMLLKGVKIKNGLYFVRPSDIRFRFRQVDCLWNLYAWHRNSCNLSEHHEFHHFYGINGVCSRSFFARWFCRIKAWESNSYGSCTWKKCCLGDNPVFQPAKPVGRIIAHATEIKRSYRLGFYWIDILHGQSEITAMDAVSIRKDHDKNM